MFLRRLVLAIGALFCMGSALLGVEFSGATWTDTSQTTARGLSRLRLDPADGDGRRPGVSVQGSAVTITATADGQPVPISVVTIEFAPTASSWQPLTGCTTTARTR